ncbi:cupin-like domain-containing protein [Myxococcus sp. AM001]|uniref:cupin-like domain-containing protein n=1 Tax=Myxococcus vastator TaxID=2709664 RepID=UPI0013D55625|nr:cupin-like domain-containing protein [Myxococcus vastator]NVJ05764.1 cupin-like domain-containing protein [Myxococcus sp. AM001]
MSTATAQKGAAPLVPERMPLDNRRAFYERIEANNKPVILTDAMKGWPAAERWTFDYFATKYRDVSVPVEWLQYNAKDTGGVERVGRVRKMSMQEYVDTLKAKGDETPGYLIGNDLFRTLPELHKDVRFDEYAVQRKLTEQLFFMGPRGTFTQLHLDRAHNLHAVMVGRKQWQLYSPRRDAELRPAKLSHPWSVVSTHDLTPHGGKSDQLPGGLAPDYDFVLEAGEILYLPYGWWHRVYTVEDAIATNYWWWTWSMLAKLGPKLIPSIALSAAGRIRKQQKLGREYREQ